MPSNPNYRGTGGGGFRSGGYGGRGYGGGGGAFSLSLPPFFGWVKRLVIANVAVYLLMLIGGIFSRDLSTFIYYNFGLIPGATLHGTVWQLITYAFVHSGFWHIAGNMFMLWMFGSQVEQDFGSRKFLEFYIFCMIGAALMTIALGALGRMFFQESANAFAHGLATVYRVPTVGASGAVYGVLMAFGILHAEDEIRMLFPPIAMKAKYFIWITILITFAFSLGPQGPVAEFAHLGGLLFGFIYLKFIPRRGLGFATSEGVYSLRNRYYKWKRRQAAKKFEVYMKKVDRSEYFDEYGNYRDPNQDPNQKDKSNGEGKGGWVN